MINNGIPTRPAFMYPWNKRTLFLGPLPSPVTVSYGAATLIVSLGNRIAFSDGYQATRVQSFLLPPGYPVVIDAGCNVVAICHLDVLGVDFEHFRSNWTQRVGAILVQPQEEEELYYAFRRMYQCPADSDTTFEMLDRLLAFGYVRDRLPPVLDARVETVVAYIKDHYQENLPIEGLADLVDISIPRLVQIFKRQTGVPIRRFRLWHRLYETLLMIGDGYSLTEAAISAGFTDSPHYTHAFGSLWGVSPSVLFSRGISAELIQPSRA